MANDKKKLTKENLRRAFEKVSQGLVGFDYLDNAAKQLMQTAASFEVDGTEQTINWNLVLDAHAKETDEEVNHKGFLSWLGTENMDVETGKAMCAYLVARLSTSLARISVLTTIVLEELLESTGLSYDELVTELGISCPGNADMKKNHSMSQAFFEAMQIATKEVMATRGYKASRDVFASKKQGKVLGLKVKLGK